MRYRRLFLGFLLGSGVLAFTLARPANASKEGGLSLYNVVLDSPGMLGSGPIHVEMKRTDDGIGELAVSAFGRNEMAPPELLESINEKDGISGVMLSWEQGYKVMGGQTVYILLTEGASWGNVVVAIIKFSEDGKFGVVENLSHEEVGKKFDKILDIH